MSDDEVPPPSGGSAQRETVREGYDRMARSYDEERSETPAEPLLSAFLAELARPATVLDAGCGSGRPVLARLSSTAEVTPIGLDFSREQLSLARDVTDGPLVAGDMTRLPVGADALEGIAAFHSIIHVPEAEHPRVYREFERALRPGGVALISVGSNAWAGANDDWLDTGVRMEWSFPGPETSRRQVREAGFDVLEEWTVDDELGGSFRFLLLRA